MLKTIACLALCLSLFSSLAAQNEVTFSIKPANAFIRVDGRVLDLSEGRVHDFAPGNYRAEVWAPQFTISELDFTVEAGKPLVVNHALRTVSTEYEVFREQSGKRALERFKRTFVDISLGAVTGFAIYLAATGKPADVDQKEALVEEARLSYRSAVTPVEVAEARDLFQRNIENFASEQDAHNRNVLIGAAVATAGAGYLIYRLIIKKRKPLPRLRFDPENPFMTDRQTYHQPLRFEPGTTTTPIGFTLTF